MYKVEGIDREIWKLAKSEKNIEFDTIRQAIKEYTQSDYKASDYECYELIVNCVGGAIEAGIVKRHMFVSAMKNVWRDPFFENLLKTSTNSSLNLIWSMLGMIRYTQVKNGDQVLIDFGQYDDE